MMRTRLALILHRVARLIAGRHIYLSTSCEHDDHAYCQAMTGFNGAKRPGICKFCDAHCVCRCHQEAP